MNTQAQQLAEIAYPGNLPAFVKKARKQGLSWRVIAADVSATYPGTITVSHETLRAWYNDAEAVA